MNGICSRECSVLTQCESIVEHTLEEEAFFCFREVLKRSTGGLKIEKNFCVLLYLCQSVYLHVLG